MARRKRVLLTGSAGLLGTAVMEVFRKDQEWELVCRDRGELDITDAAAVAFQLRHERPDLVINCAAYTRVDDCESNVEPAMRVNGDGAGNVAAASAEVGARLIHLSTDYVFDGTADRPYREDDPTGRPESLSVYGRSKLAGEQLVSAGHPQALIIRTAWLYGAAGRSFPRTILELARRQPRLEVVDDQRGSPTNARDLAQAIAELAKMELRGIVHVTNSGQCTWCEFARRIVRLAGMDVPIVPVPTERFPRPARRPQYSVLDQGRFAEAVGRPMRPWTEAVEEFIRHLDE